MKAKRCDFEPPEVRLSFLMLAFWCPALSIILMFYVLSVICAPSGEVRLDMRLLPRNSEALTAASEQPAEVVIQDDWLVKFDGTPCDVTGARKLPELQARIRAHKSRPDAATIVIYVEGTAPFQRMLDVLNAFEACGNPSYRVVVISPFVGPRIPVARPQERVPSWLARKLQLGF